MAMDFMEMREALKLAGCLVANGNEESFYGARPGATSRAIARAAAVETISRHSAPTPQVGYEPRIAPANKRQPG